MDWTAIYDDDGEEEGRWEVHGDVRSSRFAHKLLHEHRAFSFLTTQEPAPAGSPDRPQTGESHYSPVVAYAFTVNYILGVGSLGIPYAVYKSGLLMGNVLIIVVSFISYMTVTWIGETLARAQIALNMELDSEQTPLMSNSSANSTSSNKHRVTKYEHFPEVTQLCNRFLSPLGSKLYQFSLLALMYGGLLGYSQVFVNSLLSQVDHIGSFDLNSISAAILFAAIVVPLSLADLTEQIAVQLLMAVVRFAALLIMITSATYAIFADPFDTAASVASSSPPYISEYSLVDFSGFGIIFSTSVFSQLFQHSVPGLLAPLGVSNQGKSHAIFGSTLVTTMTFYIVLGTICSLYFGAHISSSINLNWANFTWGIVQNPDELPIWAGILSTIVVVFPALDTLSVYPLISVTLGDNMAAVAPRSWKRMKGWKLVCRIVACLPPLIVSAFVSDLAITLQLSGIAGVYVAFFAPALLQLSASQEIPAPNVFSTRFSKPIYVYLVLAFGSFAFLVLLYQIGEQFLS